MYSKQNPENKLTTKIYLPVTFLTQVKKRSNKYIIFQFASKFNFSFKLFRKKQKKKTKKMVSSQFLQAP
jgi:uncharacterized membrane protein